MNLLIFFTLALLLLFSTFFVACKSDDSPGFFLKITKNIPRLGRRSDKEFESYFLKSGRHIPRMGRSNEKSSLDLNAWLTDIPQPSKRVLMHPAIASAAAEREYSVVQPVNSNTLMEMIEKDAIQGDSVKFVHWKDFDRALQLDTDLYAKVISLGRKPDQQLKEDLGYSSYIPLFGNANEDDGTDYIFYNRGNSEMYPYKYDRDLVHYNRLQK